MHPSSKVLIGIAMCVFFCCCAIARGMLRHERRSRK